MVKIWILVIFLSSLAHSNQVTREDVEDYLAALGHLVHNSLEDTGYSTGRKTRSLKIVTITIRNQEVKYDDVKDLFGIVCETIPVVEMPEQEEWITDKNLLFTLGCNHMEKLAAQYIKQMARMNWDLGVIDVTARWYRTDDEWRIIFGQVKMMFLKVCTVPSKALYGKPEESRMISEKCEKMETNGIKLLDVVLDRITGKAAPSIGKALAAILPKGTRGIATYSQIKDLLPIICDNGFRQNYAHGVTEENVNTVRIMCTAIERNVFEVLKAIGTQMAKSMVDIDNWIIEYSSKNAKISLSLARPVVPVVCKEVNTHEKNSKFISKEDRENMKSDGMVRNIVSACEYLLEKNIGLLRDDLKRKDAGDMEVY